MTSSDSSQVAPETRMPCEFVRTHTLSRNLETLRVIAASLFSRNSDLAIERMYEVKEMRRVLDGIAMVISRTYAERGDAFLIADDQALMLIRDLLLQHDPTIVRRNKRRRKVRKLRRVVSRILRARSTKSRT